MPETASVELRGQAPREIVDMLDAISTHRRITRWELLIELLSEWRDDKEREAVVVARVTGCLNDRRER